MPRLRMTTANPNYFDNVHSHLQKKETVTDMYETGIILCQYSMLMTIFVG